MVYLLWLVSLVWFGEVMLYGCVWVYMYILYIYIYG